MAGVLGDGTWMEIRLAVDRGRDAGGGKRRLMRSARVA